MKTGFILILCLLLVANSLVAQKTCASYNYQLREINRDPSIARKLEAIENFTRKTLSTPSNFANREDGFGGMNIIRIPVVVHILYHLPSENISEEKILSQIAALNRDYRRLSADTANTPAAFKGLAADCEIEFVLATSDPKKRSTNGIIRKYSPVTIWQGDDKVKFSSEMGDDGWDPKSYLNIWVCNLDRIAGYSSVPGADESKDGVVIGYQAFGTISAAQGYDEGKTAVHEIGHWLNLRHIWGDADCGDDLVDDTPTQSIYTVGCPSGIRISCNNGPNGNMYMNYMDLTQDACMNMFTQGQKARMRAIFATGGIRNSILFSTGLNAPLVFESTLPEEPPRWLQPQLYPNPANNELVLDIAYDARWIGNKIVIYDLLGQAVMQSMTDSKIQHIDISRLRPGMYILSMKKEGSEIKMKFIKQ